MAGADIQTSLTKKIVLEVRCMDWLSSLCGMVKSSPVPPPALPTQHLLIRSPKRPSFPLPTSHRQGHQCSGHRTRSSSSRSSQIRAMEINTSSDIRRTMSYRWATVNHTGQCFNKTSSFFWKRESLNHTSGALLKMPLADRPNVWRITLPRFSRISNSTETRLNPKNPRNSSSVSSATSSPPARRNSSDG